MPPAAANPGHDARSGDLDFAAAVRAIMALSLSADEKAEAIRRLLAGTDASPPTASATDTQQTGGAS